MHTHSRNDAPKALAAAVGALATFLVTRPWMPAPVSQLSDLTPVSVSASQNRVALYDYDGTLRAEQVVTLPTDRDAAGMPLVAELSARGVSLRTARGGRTVFEQPLPSPSVVVVSRAAAGSLQGAARMGLRGGRLPSTLVITAVTAKAPAAPRPATAGHAL